MKTDMDSTQVEHGFRELVVWQRAIDLAESVYAATRVFPEEERYGLTAQLRRAAVSVASNIAEGRKRGSVREFRQFLWIASGSLAEVETQLEIAIRAGYVVRELLAAMFELLDHIGRMLTKLRRSLAA